jgi:thioredoxin 1
MSSKNVKSANDINFDAEVLKADKPVLVDFTATWCGPCKMLSPIVDKLADEFEGTYKVVKVDIDEAQEIAQRFGIRSVPTVMVFSQGKKTASHIGLTKREKLVEMLEGK